MLWSLSGHLPLTHLEDCFAAGKVGINGEFNCLTMDEKLLYQLPEILNIDESEIKDFMFILSNEKLMEDYLNFICLFMMLIIY